MLKLFWALALVFALSAHVEAVPGLVPTGTGCPVMKFVIIPVMLVTAYMLFQLLLPTLKDIWLFIQQFFSDLWEVVVILWLRLWNSMRTATHGNGGHHRHNHREHAPPRQKDESSDD